MKNKIKQTFSDLVDLLLSLFYVPKCVSCGLRLPTEEKRPLCPVCRAEYENEKERRCAVCAKRLSDCTCPPPEVDVGMRKLVKLFRYRPSHPDLASSKMIFTQKRRDLIYLRRFLAHELAPFLQRIMSEKAGDYLLTYPPRSSASMRRYGFDHAELLAREIAKICKIPCIRTLVRTRGRVQKQLSRAERKKNAAASYAVVQGLSLKGKRVFLLDDVVTTGATLASSARLLRKCGAREVIGVSLAVTLRENVLPEGSFSP